MMRVEKEKTGAHADSHCSRDQQAVRQGQVTFPRMSTVASH
ncbi:MAG: hypothetical protein RI993_2063 [Pseudomonadota bacterium]|jgi:hypothetical protein